MIDTCFGKAIFGKDLNKSRLMYNKNRSWRSASDVPAMKCAYNKSGRMVANNYVTFIYDANGNTAYDGLKNISLEYNQLNSLKKMVNSNNTTPARY